MLPFWNAGALAELTGLLRDTERLARSHLSGKGFRGGFSHWNNFYLGIKILLWGLIILIRELPLGNSMELLSFVFLNFIVILIMKRKPSQELATPSGNSK